MERFKRLTNILNIDRLFDVNKIYFSVNKHKKYLLPLILFSLMLISYLITSRIGPDNYNTLIFIFAPLVFLIFINKGIESILPIFILVCYINYFVYLFKLPEFLTWYVELCAIALFLKSLYVLTHKRDILIKPYITLMFLTLGVHLFSFVLNNISIEQLFISLRRYYIYYALFIAIIVLPTNIKLYETLIKVFVFTIFIQIPISIIQFFIFSRADFMGGLFGKNSSGTISTLGIGFIFLGYYLYKYYKRKKVFLFAGVGMMIPLVLAESKIAMLLLPFVYIYHLFTTERRFFYKRLIIFLIFMMPLYVGTMYLFDSLHNRTYMQESLRDPLYMWKFMTRDISSVEERIDDYKGGRWVMFNRIESIPLAFILIKDNPQKLLFGYGPGEASKSLYTPGSLLEHGFFPTFLVISLLEVGAIGMSAWLILFIYLFVINIRCLKYFLKTKSYSLWKAFCYFSNIQMLVFALEFIYSRSILLPYKALFFWITNGLIVWYYYNYIIKKKKVELIKNESQKA